MMATTKSPLNGLQRMMLRWEEFHALNAIHIVRLGRCHAPEHVAQVVDRVTRSLGLLPVSFDAKRRSILFHDEKSDGIETAPTFLHLPFVGPVRSAIEAVLNDQLNREFGTVPHWPVRFALIDTPSEGQFLALTYHHAVSDSRGVSLVLREILRALQGRVPLVRRLDLHPPSLKELFPRELGWRGLLRRGVSTASELFASSVCFSPPRHRRAEFAIEAGIHSLAFPVSLLKQTSGRLGVTVHALLAAALLEALHLHFADELLSSSRKSLAVYTPADLRRESKVETGNAVGQILGCITTRVAIPEGTAFRTIAEQVARQMQTTRSQGRDREHSAHMDVMSRIWDCLPRFLNRVAGPCLLPMAGFISNVNLSEFLAEEIATGEVQDYLRFTGTGILSPMMLGMTTVGSTVNLTTTHHTDVFSNEEIARIVGHVEWRLSGELDSDGARHEFLARRRSGVEFPEVRSPESVRMWRNRLCDTASLAPNYRLHERRMAHVR